LRYTLRRRQRLLAPPGVILNAPAGPGHEEASLPEVPAGTSVRVNRSQEVRTPAFRMNMQVVPAPYTGAQLPRTDPTYAGRPIGYVNSSSPVYPNNRVDDVLCTDILSFDVRILLHGANDFVDLYDPAVAAYANGNTAYPFTGNTPRVFDTWTRSNFGRYNYTNRDNFNPPGNLDNRPRWQIPGSYASIPLYQNGAGQSIRIRALQVNIRVWDPKTQMTRQATVVHDL
jgi:hypothetical protein